MQINPNSVPRRAWLALGNVRVLGIPAKETIEWPTRVLRVSIWYSTLSSTTTCDDKEEDVQEVLHIYENEENVAALVVKGRIGWIEDWYRRAELRIIVDSFEQRDYLMSELRKLILSRRLIQIESIEYSRAIGLSMESLSQRQLARLLLETGD